jgi:2-keto-4-pentenoate hydratase/2-oxohepta-3-ene-1,7-dioic acid hydratase in catechol pathway
MKLISFLKDGRPGFGAVTSRGVVNLSRRAAEPTLRSFLEAGIPSRLSGELAQIHGDFPVEAVQLLPVIPQPQKIFCVGSNYAAHRQEMGRPEFPYPTLFARFPHTLVAHGQPLVAPRASRELDYEGELAVVIGKRAHHTPRERALEHVAGLTCFNDATARDFQHHTAQGTPGKNFPQTGALGPWLVTRDELPDPRGLTLSLRLNGEELQRANTEMMIFDVPAIIAYLSSFLELVPGDVIATGTPSGVGSKRTPPRFLRPGDHVEVELEKVGVLQNTVVAEDSLSSA